MRKEFVTYQQAKQLKELGFDDECLTFYNYDKTLERSDDWAYGCNFEDKRDRNECLAPLKQQVFRWFREKHNLYTIINIYRSNDLKSFSFIISKQENGLNNSYKDENNFTSYEEVENECINYLIHLIKAKIFSFPLSPKHEGTTSSSWA